MTIQGVSVSFLFPKDKTNNDLKRILSSKGIYFVETRSFQCNKHSGFNILNGYLKYLDFEGKNFLNKQLILFKHFVPTEKNKNFIFKIYYSDRHYLRITIKLDNINVIKHSLDELLIEEKKWDKIVRVDKLSNSSDDEEEDLENEFKYETVYDEKIRCRSPAYTKVMNKLIKKVKSMDSTELNRIVSNLNKIEIKGSNEYTNRRYNSRSPALHEAMSHLVDAITVKNIKSEFVEKMANTVLSY